MRFLFLQKAVVLFLSRIIFNRLDLAAKRIFRKLERFLKQATKLSADLRFLEFALHNRLLPKFTDFKLYDVSAANEEPTLHFKENLLKREIEKKKNELSSASQSCIKTVLELKNNTSNLYFYSAIAYLQRINQQYDSDVTHKHAKKLSNLYGGNVFLPKIVNNVINLSEHTLSDGESSLLNRGLNFSLKSKSRPINRQIEMEKLYMNIISKKDQRKISIRNSDNLKTKLKCFGIKHSPDPTRSPLTKEEIAAGKALRNNPNIIIQRPDKGGGVVILDKTSYTSKLRCLVNDTSKFATCDNKQSDVIKNKLNRIADTFKNNNWTLYHKIKRTGQFHNGHLYGLPKIHKNEKDPPLRPIISMSGTVTHEIAQYINCIIRPYLNSDKIVRSSTEVLSELQELKLSPGDHLVSLDVESLFTNVPVNTTIDYIIDSAYNHQSLPPPMIPASTMKSLLLICTTETPFEFCGETFVQVDGVSMGSPLGPTFADFYMAQLENRLLTQKKVTNPWFYKRYVDDIIAIFHNKSHVNWFKARLSRNSVLNFTHEEVANNRFNFLDIHLQISNNLQFETSVFVKPTDKGIYTNFFSYVPLSYKKSVLKTLIYRAFRYSSNWTLFNTEIDRLKQIFANNSYPQYLVDKLVQSTLDKLRNAPLNDNPNNSLSFYVKLENIHCMQKDRKLLQNILSEHLVPVNEEESIKLIPYYKPTKLSSIFSTRPRKTELQKVNVVYQFTCQEDSCKASYIGYTTNTLEKRSSQHRYNPSSIYKHYLNDHNRPVPSNSIFKPQFCVLYNYSNLCELKIAPSLSSIVFHHLLNHSL